MNDLIDSELAINKLNLSVTDLPLPITKSVNESPDKVKPPEFLLFVAALFQKAESQDSHIKFLEKKYNRDLKKFGRKRSRKLLIKNICLENWSLFSAVAARVWKWTKWLSGIALTKFLVSIILSYLGF